MSQGCERTVRWPSGSHVLLRHVLNDQTWCALPVTVLSDGIEEVVIRIHVGTMWLAAHRFDGVRAHGWERQWRLSLIKWIDYDVTYVIPWGQWYGIAVFNAPGVEEIDKWYINCQDPIRRLPWGFDTMDRELDIVVARPEEGSVTLKDVGKFRRLVRSGALDSIQAKMLLKNARDACTSLSSPVFRSRVKNYVFSDMGALPSIYEVRERLPLPIDLLASVDDEA